MATKAEREQASQNLAKAMSHKVRADALKILSERTASPKEIGIELGANADYHVRRLVELGCAEKVGERRVRGAVETFYRATTLPLVATDEWEEIPPERRAGLIGEFIQAILDNAVRSVHAGVLGSDGKFWIGPSPPLLLSKAALEKLIELHDELAEKASELQATLPPEEGEEAIPIISAMACFPIPGPEKESPT